jgi:CRP-like cAMP-binding protein
VKTIEDLAREAPVLADLPPGQLALVGGCGQTASFRDGELLLREGEDANVFYVIREGDVALEIEAPGRRRLAIQTLHAGDLLGWSWLFEPQRVRFDARARGTVHAISFDGACLRGKCEDDHELGYELMRRFAAVIVDRLQATRLQLIDVYAPPAGG